MITLQFCLHSERMEQRNLMRKTLLLALLAASAASQANVVTCAWFPATAPFIENFDLIPSGSYNACPIFSAPNVGLVYALNPPAMVDIMPPPFWQPPALSPPNTCIGTATDVGIRVSPDMRRFGGWFRNAPNAAGIAPNFAKFLFYDASNNFLGSIGTTLSNTWSWRSFRTFPQKFARVEIYGSAGPGGVEMDDIRISPN